MIVRRVGPAEAEVWRAIRLEALGKAPEAFSARLADWQDRPLTDFAAQLEANPTFLAFEGDAPVGCISWVPEADDPSRGWIGGVFVADRMRGKGVGQALIATAVADARTAGITEMWLEVRAGNVAALKVYEQAGFAVVTDPDRPRNSCGCEIGMRRALR
ncbi:GNAT family N-acetyltransferase [Defluviimonas sp. WL0050]|uniref:GNAT family N-acetyltransferase n=1 Tax=Albidovulum litorale TaxID=2984134 RepID=A0ABT2ZK78_9RHOB|nr:GNAT family N-acetyltransferase [Defluviimonas sp. WL0050]MCV2871528.1 GNAT family N-acetyltransferase [Defluviimonas sp. WL0050]